MHGYVPLNNLIIALPIKVDEISKGGIFIPEHARKTLNEATVSLTGPLVSVDIAPGDTIVFSPHSETRVKLEGQEYVCVEEGNVLLHKKAEVAALQPVEITENGICNECSADIVHGQPHRRECSLSYC
jgi:chaperonin GroES